MRTSMVLSLASLLALACRDQAPPSVAPHRAEPSPERSSQMERSEAQPGEGAPAETNPARQERAAPERATAPPSTEPWAQVLRGFVTDDGGVRYAALAGDEEARGRLRAYVQAVGDASGEGWSRDEALAFYLNAYNALTMNAVLERWPIESVMQVEGFFDDRKHRVAGRELTLNQLENDILRSEVYAEPRIHFAVNCASASCPPLRPEPFAAQELEAQLAAATRDFVRATTRREGRTVWLSKIFEWFAGDFERVGGVRAFVASQLAGADAEAVRDPGTRLRYDEYDWALNARP